MSVVDEHPYTDAPEAIVTALGGRVPTLQQWRAISHPLEPVAIVAGAGSGKTAVMVARVVYLALVRAGVIEAEHDGAAPSDVLCLTFTNKAAEELSRRVMQATAGLGLPDGEEVTVATYHSFAARLLDEFGLRMGMEPQPQLLSEAHKWQLAASLLANRAFEHLEVRTLRHVVEQVLQLADECANHLVDAETLLEHSRVQAAAIDVKTADDRYFQEAHLRRAELAELVAAYRERKRERNLIDYGDQIMLAQRLVEERPEVVEEFRSRYRVVLLDEYQDTNVAQARLLRTLCGPGFPIMAVGDPDQNIYPWRGASLANILRFGADFGDEDAAPTRPLYVNFRSGSRILKAADTVIQRVPEDRRAPDKTLRPDPARGEGRVRAFVAADERAEGRRIAALIKEEVEKRAAGGEPRWEDVAILCRKKRLFGPIHEVLREAGIPVEVVDLGGLLQLPEIVDVVAWLRILDDPSRNVALARLLMGPRWRIGYRDMVGLARWSVRRNRGLSEELPGEDVRPGDISFSLADALEQLDDDDLRASISDEAYRRLQDFQRVLADVREATHESLSDLAAQVLERSGLMRELEASAAAPAMAARRNLMNFVQHITLFAPVDGEATLSTLIAYLDAAEESEDELEPVQPSDANTVKMLTIHKAKGLEWPVVFVPGLASGGRSSLFPDTSRQPDPLKQPARVPFELRGDRDVLPTYDGNVKRWKEKLKERGEEEERRLCYVALTRARDELIVSSAYWYEGPMDPFEPSMFYEEVSAADVCEEIGREELPEDNPVVAERARRAEGWPGPGARDDVDELFPEGWHDAARTAAEQPVSVDERVGQLGADQRAAYQARLDADLERVALIEERTVPERGPAIPSTLSVTSVMDYMRCPKLFYWSRVRPLPRRPSEAARRGSEVHRWIELQARGQATLIEVDELPDLSTEERLTEPGDTARLKQAFRDSRFAGQVPLFAERPFLLYLDGYVIGGRIDAIFGLPGGRWEVVDYKTGRAPDGADALSGLQLDLYALACQDVWGKRPEELVLTYFYLADGKEITRDASGPEETRARIVTALDAMSAGGFDPIPGEQCHWCDFLAFCEAGKRHVAQR